MIITRTPFRITLGGGGTDLPSYYREHGGFVFAMGIDKYMYIMVNPPTVDDLIRLHYSRSETVSHVSELQHELAREALRHQGIERRMEVSSMADLPDGTGLGSSGSYLVGLLTALHHYRRDYVSIQRVAEEACTIELEILEKAVGKQDQYMAAFGGLTVLDIDRDGSVAVRSVEIPSGSLAALLANTHMYYTGVRRSATEILREQDSAMTNGGGAASSTADALHRIKELGYRILEAIEGEDYDGWGALLHEHWESKKRLSNRITLSAVDQLYDHVRSEYGVLGGKIAGAGGGGFLMLYCPSDHGRLEAFMASQGMPRLHYQVAHEGAKVVANLTSAPGLRQGRPLETGASRVAARG
jgi:D-glycero-alpha-D-manno-heptose-7-phosphate kinase